MKIEETVAVRRAPGETFDYLSEFANTAEWDPGIAESRKLTDGPVRVGTEYDVVAVFRGNRQPFRYRVTELEPGRRVALAGESAQATSVDAIEVEPDGSGSRVHYSAEIKLKGLRRVAEPFLRGTLEETGREALAGLKRTLDAPAG